LILPALPSTNSVTACSRVYNLDVLIGFVRPVAPSCDSALLQSLSPFRSWALLRLNPRARRSALFCFLGSPVPASNRIRHAGPPQQSTSPPLGAGPLAFGAPSRLGKQFQS